VSVQQAFRHPRIALLGLLAVLFQAILFGWHHHPVPLASRGAQAIAVAANSAVPLSPADAEDGCDICAALHHLSASPIEFVSLLLPSLSDRQPVSALSRSAFGPPSAASWRARHLAAPTSTSEPI
jgi:hypothetical protein